MNHAAIARGRRVSDAGSKIQDAGKNKRNAKLKVQNAKCGTGVVCSVLYMVDGWLKKKEGREMQNEKWKLQN